MVYWCSDQVKRLFAESDPVSKFAETREGLTTGSNGLFLREWHEVAFGKAGIDIRSTDEAAVTEFRWFPYVKGGEYRRWSGNFEHFVNWYHNGVELREFSDLNTGRIRSHNYNGEYGFKSGFTWSGMSSGSFSVRHVPPGYMFDAKGPMGFPIGHATLSSITAFFNSRVASHLLKMLAPTMDFKLGHVLNLPLRSNLPEIVTQHADCLAATVKWDWDAYETSWDFATLPLLSSDHRANTLGATYARLRAHWQGMTDEMQRLEEENNRIFIDAYGLQDELMSAVPIEEITLTCNPAFRYGGGASEEVLETRLLADTMREFLSYAIGCMFGRYSLDEPGLILANQGDGIERYLAKVPKPKFAPTADNIIPLLDRDWVDGDTTTRFHTFLRTTFGDERFEENLAFVEAAIGKDVRKFFLRDFFADNLKRYKKRPVYWLFSSGPERAFQCLVYLHRYDESTLARMRTEYVLPLQGHMAARIEQIEGDKLKATSTSLRKRLQKEQDDLKRQIKELLAFEEKLRHVADQRIILDLDDGVKVNYAQVRRPPGRVARDCRRGGRRMSDLDQIHTALERLFNEEGQRIVFWNDPEQGVPEHAAVPRARRRDHACGSMKSGRWRPRSASSGTNPTAKFLLYAPTEEPDYDDDWLLDIRLYSRSFRADRASILLQELGLVNQHLRRTSRRPPQVLRRQGAAPEDQDAGRRRMTPPPTWTAR